MYCDFVVWTQQDVHIEQIYPNEAFWNMHTQRVEHFFKVGILPELLGKFFTRIPTTPVDSDCSDRRLLAQINTDSADTTEETDVARYRYCYCQEDKEGQMIGCDNSLCKYEWFHFQCLGLFCKPKSKKWYCPDCRKLPEFRRKSTKKSKADS